MWNPFSKSTQPEQPVPDPALDEERWNKFNEEKRAGYRYQVLMFGWGNYEHPNKNAKLAREFFRKRILEVELSPDNDFAFTANRYEDHADFNWDEECNQALPEDDLVYEAQLITGYMDKLKDKDDQKSLEHKDLYQYLAISVLPALSKNEQKDFAGIFQWRRYYQGENHLFKRYSKDPHETWYRSNANYASASDDQYKPFHALRGLYEKTNIVPDTKLVASNTVQNYLETVLQDKTVGEATVRALFHAFATTVLQGPPIWHITPKAKELVNENLEFINKHVKDSDGIVWWDGDYFYEALDYIKDKATRREFVLSQIAGEKASISAFSPKRQQKLRRMFPGDSVIEQMLQDAVAEHEEREKRAEEENRKYRLEHAGEEEERRKQEEKDQAERELLAEMR